MGFFEPEILGFTTYDLKLVSHRLPEVEYRKLRAKDKTLSDLGALKTERSFDLVEDRLIDRSPVKVKLLASFELIGIGEDTVFHRYLWAEGCIEGTIGEDTALESR